jgi:mannose-6-phosphate isomerase-like protein (cupin superfamily)
LTDGDEGGGEVMTDIVTKEELPHVIGKGELPHGGISHKFEGYRYGDVGVSFFLVESPPGGGAVLHTHPYEEVFLTLEGEATFTVGDATIEVGAGQIVVAPAGVPHKFVNSGTGPLRQVDIHPSGRILQEDIVGGS